MPNHGSQENSLPFMLPGLELTFASKEPELVSQLLPLPDLELSGNWQAEQSSISHAATVIQPETAQAEQLAETLFELAGLQVTSGNFAKAEKLLSQALALVEEKLGPEHLAAAQILANLGTVHLLQSKYEYAERFLYRSIVIFELHSGTQVETARSFNNLSAVYNKLGEYGEGEKCLAEALAVMEQTLLEEIGHMEHPEIIPILENYAELYAKTNRWRESTAAIDRVLAIKKLYDLPQVA